MSFEQIYMGVLTQKCIKNFPAEEAEQILHDGGDGSLDVNSSSLALDTFHKAWAKFNRNSSNWDGIPHYITFSTTLIVIYDS